jgi:GNAT superfamily N-acetyltransferase
MKSTRVTTDAQLIKAARTDPEAFGELYGRHATAVHSFLRSRAPDRVAGELTAETFAQAALSLGRFRDEMNRDAPNAGFDPALWIVVRGGGTIGGLQRSWRGRGLGEALLLHSLHAFRRRGRRRAALNVDVDNTTGALRLYTKVGMEPTPAFTVWSKTLDKEDPSNTYAGSIPVGASRRRIRRESS